MPNSSHKIGLTSSSFEIKFLAFYEVIIISQPVILWFNYTNRKNSSSYLSNYWSLDQALNSNVNTCSKSSLSAVFVVVGSRFVRGTECPLTCHVSLYIHDRYLFYETEIAARNLKHCLMFLL